jgi:uncharacterized protein (TIGR02145 family)
MKRRTKIWIYPIAINDTLKNNPIKNKIHFIQRLILIFALIFSVSSCKKNSSDPEPPPPSNYEHGIINGSLINGVTLQPIASGLVSLTNLSGTILKQVTSGSNGAYTITGIGDGIYQVKVQQTGYKEMVADSVVISSVNPKGNFVGLCPVETSFTTPVSALSGIILDNSASPITNVTVSISADPEFLTNGYFSTVLTNSNGQFVIPAIPLRTVGLKTLIPSFKIKVMKDNYETSYITGIVLLENRMKVRNTMLPPASGGTVTDIDGNIYHTVTIGTRVWMVENLKTTKYNDGTSIPLVTDGAAWSNLTNPGYCWYNNDAANKNTYGALYNWFTVNTGILAPTGWHIPSDAEWTTLTTYLGGESAAGSKLKETGTTHWQSPNTGATNETGFTALPGGTRGIIGAFGAIGSFGHWWGSTEGNTSNAWERSMKYSDSGVGRYGVDKSNGFSVRCTRD